MAAPASSATVRRRVGEPTKSAGDAFSRWSEFYKSHPDSPWQLLNLLGQWRDIEKGDKNASKANAEIEGILKAYLTHNGKQAQSWMYEQLAVAIELNKGSANEVKESLDWAAELAQREGEPNAMLSVVDSLMIRNYGDTVGPAGHKVQVADLIKKIADKVPHRGEPLMMGVLLAGRRKDPALMTWSTNRLLALGWPGMDDDVRANLREKTETLAEALKKDDRKEEAEQLLDGFSESWPRDILITLTWEGYGDLDLRIEEPLGATACYLTPRTVFGGSLVKNGFGKHPEEVYVCPRGFDGDYAVRVESMTNDPKDPIHDVKLEVVLHEGAPNEERRTYDVKLDSKKPVVATLKGGRRKEALPFIGALTTEELLKASAPRKKKRAKIG